MQQNAPDLLVGVADWLPEDFAVATLEVLEEAGATASVHRYSMGPYAGVELYLRTAVGIFIAAGFFNGFLAKAGEDAYEKLKAAARSLFRKSAAVGIKIVGSQGKLREKRFSGTFAISCALLPNLRVKLLVGQDQTIDEIETGINLFFDLMRDIQLDRLGREELERLFRHGAVGGTALMTFDATLGCVVAVDGPVEARDAKD